MPDYDVAYEEFQREAGSRAVDAGLCPICLGQPHNLKDGCEPATDAQVLEMLWGYQRG